MPTRVHNGFQSALAAGVFDPALILEFHRATFGPARMTADDGANDPGGTGDGTDDPPSMFTDPDTGETYAFPSNTKVSDMTAEQKAEYWKHNSRRWETRAKAASDYEAVKAERDRLKQVGMTADEKAIEDARKGAREEALRESAVSMAEELLRARLSARGKKDDEIDAALRYVNLAKFVDDQTGKVNRDEITKFVDASAPTNGRWPDMGGGQRGSELKPKKGEAGRAEAERRYAKKS